MPSGRELVPEQRRRPVPLFLALHSADAGDGGPGPLHDLHESLMAKIAEVHIRDDLPHRSEGDRFAIYAVRRPGAGRGPEGRRRICETSLDGIGSTLMKLSEEGEYGEGDRVGIFDRKTRLWLINPWAGTSPWIPTD